jgi:hypothetical protein
VKLTWISSRVAVAGLLLLVLITGAGNLAASYIEVHHLEDAQRAQGRLVEHKICTTFGKLAALNPPAGDPRENPSRGYLQQQHVTLVELGHDIGCP